jgi:2-C-methyl-D-erythritol 4-phosphate cytidylyltransferase
MAFSKISDFARKVLPPRACGAVIVAGGSASRMGGIDKVMAELCGCPTIVHAVRAFDACDAICEIVIVTRPDLVEPIQALCGEFSKVRAVVVGGSSRQESVENGLTALSKGTKMAAIHDGARPLITQAVIDRTVRAAHLYGAAAPVIPVKDTIKTVAAGLVADTPDRASLRAVQTPQVFDRDLLEVALQKAKEDGAAVTDDCSAVERLGMRIKIVEGEERNIKVTTPLDLKIAELFMEEKQ